MIVDGTVVVIDLLHSPGTFYAEASDDARRCAPCAFRARAFHAPSMRLPSTFHAPSEHLPRAFHVPSEHLPSSPSPPPIKPTPPTHPTHQVLPPHQSRYKRIDEFAFSSLPSTFLKRAGPMPEGTAVDATSAKLHANDLFPTGASPF